MPSRSHKGFATQLRDALNSIERTFGELVRIQYSAPWNNPRRGSL